MQSPTTENTEAQRKDRGADAKASAVTRRIEVLRVVFAFGRAAKAVVNHGEHRGTEERQRDRYKDSCGKQCIELMRVVSAFSLKILVLTSVSLCPLWLKTKVG